MATPLIRVLVVDDFEPFRRLVAKVLQQQPELQIICEVSDGLEAVQKAEEIQPDLVLMDIGLPNLNGIEAAHRIRKLSPKSKILFVSQETSTSVVQGALASGGSGYVLKMDARNELLAAVNAVLGGKQFVGAILAGNKFADPQGRVNRRSHSARSAGRSCHRTRGLPADTRQGFIPTQLIVGCTCTLFNKTALGALGRTYRACVSIAIR